MNAEKWFSSTLKGGVQTETLKTGVELIIKSI
jgi:hypothetical protein